MNSDIISQIQVELTENADENTKNSCQRFFKEGIKCYGVKSAAVSKIAKKYFKKIDQEPKNRKKELFSLCEELLKSDYYEEASIAFKWADLVKKDYSEEDFLVFEHWIEDYVNNWAKCDTLCNHAVGSFLEEFPPYIEKLKGWADSENRWFRRAAAVSLVLPARKGKFLPEIFEIADKLLKEEDDLVIKGYGWMLKEASKAHRQEVFEYVMKNKNRMSRTALRYAIEKFPADLRKKAMEK